MALSLKKAILVLPKRSDSTGSPEADITQKESEVVREGFPFSKEEEWHAELSPSEMTVPAFYMDALSY